MTRRSGRRSAVVDADRRLPARRQLRRARRHAGIDPASIEITVEKNLLTVKAERTWQPSEGDQMIVSERLQGSFTRQLL